MKAAGHISSEEILKVLEEATEPLSIDAVRFRAGMRSWDTARAILLELLCQKKVEGMKSSKGWTFWRVMKVREE